MVQTRTESYSDVDVKLDDIFENTLNFSTIELFGMKSKVLEKIKPFATYPAESISILMCFWRQVFDASQL